MSQLQKDRMRSLLSIDDMVHEIVLKLQEYPDQMDNTYIIYTRYIFYTHKLILLHIIL